MSATVADPAEPFRCACGQNLLATKPRRLWYHNGNSRGQVWAIKRRKGLVCLRHLIDHHPTFRCPPTRPLLLSDRHPVRRRSRVTTIIFQNPRFDALRSALYHAERYRFFDCWNRIFNFVVILLGAGAAAKVARLVNLNDIWIELGIVVMATLQLVFDFGGMARVHEFLRRRHYEVLAEIEQSKNVDEEAHKWSAKLIALTADEPMGMRALEAIAYNKAVDALIPASERAPYRQEIQWWHRLLRHFWAFQSTEFGPKRIAS